MIHQKIFEAYKHYSYPTKDTQTRREYDGPNWFFEGDSPMLFENHGRTVHHPNSSNRSAIGNKPIAEIPPIWTIKVDNLTPGGWCGIGVAPVTARTVSFTGSEQFW